MHGAGRGRRGHGREIDDALLVALARGRRTARRRRRRVAPLVLLVLLASVGALAAFVGSGGANAVIEGSCSLRSVRPIRLGATSFVETADGTRLGAIPSTVERQPLPLSRISPWLVKATVAIEDRRFYQHGGLDWLGIARAAVADAAAGRVVEGGSTLEQELARNLYLGSDPRTLPWKLEQACLAVRIAERDTRREILGAYLNRIPYGNLSFGAGAAAETYFGRPADSLTVEQAALLAGLPQAPTLYDPFTHPSAARARRNEVLRALEATGQLSRAAYRWAVRRPLGLRRGSLFGGPKHAGFVAYLARALTVRFGRRAVESGGLRVQTTLDERLQDAARASIASVLRTPGDPAGAVVAIDPRTGAVRAMTSYRPGVPQLSFDLAADARRQEGSAFKPFVLATAFERGYSLGSTFVGPSAFLVSDPRCYTGTQPWLVHNYGGESFGALDLATATADSVNTVFAQLVDQVGPANVVRVAHRMGIGSPLQAVCSITLGTQPLSPLELTDAYATLAAGGVHHPAQVLETVRNRGGRVVARLDPHGRRALPAAVAGEVTQALEGVVRSGTGTAAALAVPAAGKTGTAEHEQDAWFCGYVPQRLATCVWVGYPGGEIPMHDVEGVPAVVGGSLPAEIWHAFMTRALRLP